MSGTSRAVVGGIATGGDILGAGEGGSRLNKQGGGGGVGIITQIIEEGFT